MPVGSVRRKLDGLLATAHDAAGGADERLELIGLLEEGRDSLERLAQELRSKTLVLK